MKRCGNCGWDGVTPLHGDDPKMCENVMRLDKIADTGPQMEEVSWGKQGEWTMYKQEIPLEPSAQDDNRLKGCLVFYIDVGQLPPYKAEAFVERMKDNFRSERLKKNYELIFVPVRPNGNTRVEFIPFSY